MTLSLKRPARAGQVVFCSFALAAAPLCAAAERIPMTEAAWRINAEDHRFESYKGRESLYLKNGGAEAAGIDFENGVIELDIAFANERGFSGVAFRRQGPGEYEHFYLRPHQNGQPDASQYTPEFHGLSAWQILYGPRYAAALDYRFDEWMHVKLVISGEEADIYVDSDKPVLHIEKLMRDRRSGSLSLNSFFAPAHFANVSVDRTATAVIIGESAPLPAPAPGAIMEWEISPAFDFKTLKETTQLSREDLQAVEWRTLAVEENGVANIARVAEFGEGRDAAFARLVINSPRRQTRRLRFGFSDEVKAFVNGALVYSGADGYMSRDHRFLGTVGLHDAIRLPLKKGRNEIIFAVKENFGGWAIAGALDEGDDQ